MSKSLIQADKNFPKIHDFIMKHAESRLEAVKRKTLQLISENAKNSIIDRAPNDSDLKNYQKDLQVYLVQQKQPRYAILFSGRLEDADTKDKDTTILYIRPVKRKVG